MFRLKVIAAALGVLAVTRDGDTGAGARGEDRRYHDRPSLVAAGGAGAERCDLSRNSKPRRMADDRLVAVSTPLAEKVELHRSTMEEGVHRMEAVESIVVPAGGSVALAPGGLHVMLVGLKFMLMAEETIPVTLTFERSGAITRAPSR